ncbi:transglutaminase family protein [Pseudohalioglobus lutimaris]|uniref:Transglutaminase family protein n=1 Tax=Pseudohalioglobus lutimaris TaxID=1737061 RepID=A0A2N5X4D9_9GAMM|nr:transglutaminase family protein [Pseudohalioglobus lutimaris]PLW69340.1 transglutaminase family protein [Pseudohalioglobus lutimaris]
MQRYKILHRTYYNFSNPVTLGPHILRLRPREDHELRIEAFDLKISPEANVLWHRDVESNSIAIASFSQPTQQLAIESEVIIQQYLEKPLDFLVADYAVNYPFRYQQDDLVLLAPYLSGSSTPADPQLAQWIEAIWHKGEAIETYGLLQRITDAIHQRMTYKVREEPGVQTANDTLSRASGSCRDFAMLLMAAARQLGLAARFVTGYLHAPLSTDAGATHAWAEIYLPGAGWKGFDPTIGAIVGTDHIPVAVARVAESVPPVEGTFVGNAGAELDVGVWVSQC